jgi:predicted deacylase
MKHLGMIEGAPPRRQRCLEIRDYWRVSPRAGGYLEPAVGLDRQFTETAPGEILGRVTSPVTFELLDELRSPGRGVIFYMCRSHMVRPGGWAFGVAPLEGSPGSPSGAACWFERGS